MNRQSPVLRIATCQFPVTENISENARWIRSFMKKASHKGAHLLHTSEACLSGYAGTDYQTFNGFAWEQLRRETERLRNLAAQLHLWLILGSAHYLDPKTKPTNCVYIINPSGALVNRYDKCMLTPVDAKFYSAGNRLVTEKIRGVSVGFAICYDICYPQLYAAYRQKGVTLMLHSFYNARDKGPSCLDVLNQREVPTRCADNRLWAVANNSSHPHSHWGSFIARPDCTIPVKLKPNHPGMIVHDFPDCLASGGWLHNTMPMKVARNESLHLGTPSQHPRQKNGRSEP